MKKNLSIIITGQLRTFFSNNYFTNVLIKCIEKYNKILVICVLNSKNEKDFLDIQNYFKGFKIYELILINYSDDKYTNDFILKMNNKYTNPYYETIFEKYKQLNTQGFVEISDPKNTQNSIRTQFHQISIGFSTLKEYMAKSNFTCDITFKTRFDIIYPIDFYPHMPESSNLIDILSFNESNKTLIVNSMTKYNLHSIDDLILFNKQNTVKAPNCRIKNVDHWPISFGGEYVSNFISLEYIKNNNNNIIYSFGGFFEFGETKNMLIFEKLFDDFWIREPIDTNIYTHFYAPENQIINFCISNNIPILCYRDYCYVR